MDGKGRFALSHTTPLGNIKKNPFPPIKLSDGRVITNYTITLTFRRAADLTPGMPKTPAKITTTQSSTSVKPTIDTSKEWKGDLESRPVYTAEGVNTMRTTVAKPNEHFGNPFSEAGYGNTIKVDSIADAVIAYKDWLLNGVTLVKTTNKVNLDNYLKPFEAQRQWILNQINQGKLDGATLLYAGKSERRGQGMHPTALAEVVEELRGTQPSTSVDREYTPENITKSNLPANGFFVFGSNDRGNHGLGAAKSAVTNFGAVYGQASGQQGKSFAIRTKMYQNNKLTKYNELTDENKALMDKMTIKDLNDLRLAAIDNPNNKYYVTEIGTKLAGRSVEQMKNFFTRMNNKFGIPDNIILPKVFEVRTTQSSTSVKPGVTELFESYPELANAVYEALGFGNFQSSIVTKLSNLIEGKKEVYTLYNSVLEQDVSKNGYKLTIPEFPDVIMYITQEKPSSKNTKGSTKFNIKNKEWTINILHPTQGVMYFPASMGVTNKKDVIEDFITTINEKYAKSERGRKILAEVGITIGAEQSNQITPQQKQEAQDKFQEYVNATGKQDIEGFKEFIGQSQASIGIVKITDQYKYFGAMYTIKLNNGVGVDVEGYKGKPLAKLKLLNAYNENPDVDPQNGRKFREDVDNAVSLKDKKEDQSILNMRTNMIDYTSKQKKALLEIESIIDSGEQAYYLLAGYAGTGKTTIAENIAKYAQFKNKNVKIIAPTNKAAKVLRDKLKKANVNGINAQTIHKTIYGAPNEITGEWVKGKPVNNSVIIIDESSMISKDVMQDLLETTNTNNVVVFMGDGFQLEPVGEDSGLFTGKVKEVKAKTELTEVKRQTLDSNILKVATLVRTDDKAYVPQESYEDFKVVRDKIEFINDYKKAIRENEDVVMIVATNAERILMNKIARKEKYKDDVAILNDDDVVMSVANSDTYPNSDTFKVKHIIDSSDIMEFTLTTIDGKSSTYDVIFVDVITEDGEDAKIMLIPELDKPSLYHGQVLENASGEVLKYLQRNKLIKTTKRGSKLSPTLVIGTYGYAVTAHKSQGSQWSKVFVNQNYVAPTWNAARWYYTAITRATDNVEVFVTNNNLRISSEKIEEKINEIALESEDEFNNNLENKTLGFNPKINISYSTDNLIIDKYFSNSRIQKASDILSKIANSNYSLNNLAKFLLKYNSINNVDIGLYSQEFIKTDTVLAAGVYYQESNTIAIAEFAKFYKGNSETVILHEILHALSYKALRKNNEFTADFKKLYESAKNQLELYDPKTRKGTYGTYDIDEFFVALFTDSEFILELQNLDPIDIKNYKNLFEEIFDYILNLLNITKGNSLYNQAFAVASNMLQEESDNTYAMDTISQEEVNFESKELIYSNVVNYNINKPKGLPGIARTSTDCQ